MVVFMKGGKLSRDEKWWLDEEEMEVVKEMKYLHVMLDSRGKWGKKREQVITKGKIVLSVARMPNIEVKLLEQICNSLTESCMTTQVGIWGLGGGWKVMKKVHEMFCKRISGIPSTAVNGVCVRELGRTNRREKLVERIIKYWTRLWEMDKTSLLTNALK
jgi:hypothetical protein